MTLKIYDCAENRLFHIKNFHSFFVETDEYHTKNEFMIINQTQRFSVKLGEIFELHAQRYFLFDDTQLNFLTKKNHTKRIYAIHVNIKSLPVSADVYLNFVFGLILIFYITKIMFLDV